jgi:hypothetical protein
VILTLLIQHWCWTEWHGNRRHRYRHKCDRTLPSVEPLPPSVDLLRLNAMPLRRRNHVPTRKSLAHDRALLLSAPTAAADIGPIVHRKLSSTAADTRCRSNECEKLNAERPSRKAALGVWIRQTAVLETPASRMIDAVPAPFAVNKTIRQRQTCFWGELRLTTMASSRRSSEAVTVMDIPVRMRQIRTNNQNGESQIGLARQARSTSTVWSWKSASWMIADDQLSLCSR